MLVRRRSFSSCSSRWWNRALFVIGIATEGRLCMLYEVRVLGGIGYVTAIRLLDRLAGP
jgi:hypothetical protein